MYIMQVGGPPPPLGLARTSHVGDPVNIVSQEELNSIINEAKLLLNNQNANITSAQRTFIINIINSGARDRGNITRLQNTINYIKMYSNLEGGRRRRTRRNKKAKKSKKSMRRRR
jgi:hypothetical protein